MIEPHSFFTNMIMKGGILGILTLFLSFVGFLLSIFSILSSLNINKQKLPIALKLLILCSIATLLTGTYGTVAGYIKTFAMLGTTTGAAKVSIMEHANQTARIPLIFGIVSFLIQFLISIISLFFINKRSKEINIPELSMINLIKKVPFLLYPGLTSLLPVLIGIILSFWSIEKIIEVKPKEPMPPLLQINFEFILPIAMFFSFAGIILSIILFILFLIKRIREKYVDLPE